MTLRLPEGTGVIGKAGMVLALGLGLFGQGCNRGDRVTGPSETAQSTAPAGETYGIGGQADVTSPTSSCGSEYSAGNPYPCCANGANCTWYMWKLARERWGRDKGRDVAYCFSHFSRWKYAGGDYDTAIEYAELARGPDRSFADAHFLLGWYTLFVRESDPIEHFRATIEKDPEYLARITPRSGDHELSPHNQEASRTDAPTPGQRVNPRSL